MDKFYEIAKLYFEEFEGTHLYPKLRSWVGLLWLAALGYAGYLLFYQSMANRITPSNFETVVALGSILLAYGAVQDHKSKALTQRNSGSPNLKAARIKTLERLTGASSGEFLQVANDLTALMQLRQQHGPQRLRLRDYVPIPWPRGQFLMHALTIVGVLLTVIGTFFPELVTFVRSHITIQTLIIWGVWVALFAFLSLFAYPQTVYIWHNVKSDWRNWRARLQKDGLGNPVHLEYLLQHLIKFHNPLPTRLRTLKAVKPYSLTNRPPRRTLR